MTEKLIDRNPDVLGGTPVFSGTRVPVRILMEHLEAGDRLDDFLNDYPTVTREQAVGVLERRVAAPRGGPWVRCSRHGGPRIRVSAEPSEPPDPRRHHDRRTHPISGIASPRPGSDRGSLGRPWAASPPCRGLRAPCPKSDTRRVQQVGGAGGLVAYGDGHVQRPPARGSSGVRRGRAPRQPWVIPGVCGSPEAQITAGNHVSLTRAARSAIPTVGEHPTGSSRNSRNAVVNGGYPEGPNHHRA